MTDARPQPSPVLSQLLSDPRWFLAELDGEANAFRFVHTDHETLAAQAFLDRRWSRDGLPSADVPIDELLARAPMRMPPTRVNFLWHSGFCCSTLIARLLDLPGRNLSLSEPQVLTTLADARRAGALPDRDTSLRACQVVFHLLGRPLEPGAAVTIKPTPSSCCFLGEAAQLTSGRMLFLYSDCRSFVISVVKLGEEGRQYVQRMLQALTIDGEAAAPARDLSELQSAAVLWHLQMAPFRRQAALLGARAASLDCDAFLADPHRMLAGIDDFLGLKLGSDRVAAVLEGPLFRRNAKDASQSFSPDRRREEHAAAARQLGAALDDAIAYADRLYGNAPMPNPLAPLERRP